MRASASSSAASTMTYESDLSLNGYGKSCEEARLFDSLLKKLETVRISSSLGRQKIQQQERDDDFEKRPVVLHRDSTDDESRDSEDGRFSRHWPAPHRSERSHRHRDHRVNSRTVEEPDLEAEPPEENSFSEEKLPQAILKLDRRHAIPRPRQKNDVLVEIEACTIEKRSLSTRPGIRSSLHPTPIETIAVDCVGRVVQLTTHTRAIHGVGLEDRVAALYPFEYCDKGSDKGSGGSGGKRKGLGRYALVDAGFVVTVPKQIDGAQAACLIRLYMTAFQSIQMGILHTTPTHDRYEMSQLQGKSILIQNGHTELGLALIELAMELGAYQIFATGPSEHHSKLRNAGATPLGDQTFRWELFLTEKLSLVLLQDMPSAENFEHFLRVLDDETGSVVKINCWPQNQGEEEHDNNHALAGEGGECELLSVKDVTENLKCAFDQAKFQLMLACCSQYLTYDGVWASSKEDPNLWKEDLRFLLALLGENKLNPRVHERICLEDVAETQDRIELYGKSNTIVCLPFKTTTETAFAVENEDSPPVTPVKHPETREVNALKVSDEQNNSSTWNQTANYATLTDAYVERFAIDSGYLPSQKSPVDTLSDFHHMDMYTARGGINAHNISCVGDSPEPYHNPLLDHRSTRLEKNCAYNNHGASELVAPRENSYHRTSPPTPNEQMNTQPPSSKMSRRSRIIQKIKTQHRSIAQESAQSKELKDSKSQWRKLRRDARARGQSRLVERSTTSTLDDENGSLTDIKNDDPQHPTIDETKDRDCGDYEDNMETKDFASDKAVEVWDESHENNDEDLQVPDDEEVCIHEQSLMQRNDSESLTHHDSPSAMSTLNIVQSEERVVEEDCTKKEETRQASPIQSNAEHEEKSSSFQSLMNKWKSIESGR